LVANSELIFWNLSVIIFLFSLKTDEEILKIVRKKTKTAAWFVSNCKTHSRREKLVKKLQRHGIKTDVFGYCGKKKCRQFPNQCVDLQSTYKFYFAFENSLCVDYLTEKVFRNLKDVILLVVFNGANMTNFLPPKSVNINIFVR
jgi:alpha-1,3-fucosyltransferase